MISSFNIIKNFLDLSQEDQECIVNKDPRIECPISRDVIKHPIEIGTSFYEKENIIEFLARQFIQKGYVLGINDDILDPHFITMPEFLSELFIYAFESDSLDKFEQHIKLGEQLEVQAFIEIFLSKKIEEQSRERYISLLNKRVADYKVARPVETEMVEVLYKNKFNDSLDEKYAEVKIEDSDNDYLEEKRAGGYDGPRSEKELSFDGASSAGMFAKSSKSRSKNRSEENGCFEGFVDYVGRCFSLCGRS